MSKPEQVSLNFIVELHEGPCDLNCAYENAGHMRKDHLAPILGNYHQRSMPNLALIQEMINVDK